MAGPGPKASIETAPELIPAQHGLLRTIEPLPAGDERWGNGIVFEPIGCGDDVQILEICGPEVTKNTGNRQTPVEVDPFVIVSPAVCSTFGSNGRDFRAKAKRKLEACQSYQIERELWTGTLIPTNPRLASPASTDISPPLTPSEPADALAIMEQELGECSCGSRGIIHATRRIASLLASLGLVEAKQEPGMRYPVLQTKLGTLVVAGPGYPGTSPTGATTAGVHWMYGTGIVNVILGEAEVFPQNDGDAIDRALNTRTYRAEKPAIAFFDPCCVLAIQVAL